MQQNTVPPGIYRHYKEKDYKVFFVAKHSETEEELVVYQSLWGEHGYWVRPKSMFCEEVEVDGKMIPRFRLIEELS